MSRSSSLLLCVGIALLCCSHASASSLKDLLHRPTTTTSTSTTTTTTAAPATTEHAPLFISSNIPKMSSSCTINFVCKKRLTKVAVPKPCVKYCIKNIACPDAATIKGETNQCVELDEALVTRQHENDVREGAYTSVVRVAMIDFPCQPGFLPDYKGRCREVW